MKYTLEADWNPLTKIRLAKGMNTYQFAKLAGISRGHLSLVEHGGTLKLSRRILAAVEKLGYDPEEIQREYIEWRERKTEAPVRVVKR